MHHLPLPPKEAIQSSIWKSGALPKIKAFSWILCHKKVLTVDNLKKRGIQGPSRFPLCNKQQEETLQHLFLECDFSKEVWRILQADLIDPHITPISFNETYLTWHRRYPASFHKKPLLKRVWTTLPFYINWKWWQKQKSCSSGLGNDGRNNWTERQLQTGRIGFGGSRKDLVEPISDQFQLLDSIQEKTLWKSLIPVAQNSSEWSR